MANLLDLMSKDDRELMLSRFRERTANKGYDNRISSEIYLVAEFGYYFGWEAVNAVRHNEVTIEEMYSLLEGARKVWYQKLVEQGKITTTAVATPFSKHPQQTFKQGMKPFLDRSKI